MCHGFDPFKLSVYNSSLQCLRSVECKSFSKICCNSKFVFGVWDTGRSYETDSDDDDNNGQKQEEYSTQRIQVRHLDTLSKAFCLVVPKKYTIERIIADEHRLVAMSQQDHSSRQWFMSVFDLTTCNTSRKFFLAERHIRLDTDSVSCHCIMCFCSTVGWSFLA